MVKVTAGKLRTYVERALHKLDVDVANHVIRQVVTDIQMLYLAVLVHLLKDILIEILVKQKISQCLSTSTTQISKFC